MRLEIYVTKHSPRALLWASLHEATKELASLRPLRDDIQDTRDQLVATQQYIVATKAMLSELVVKAQAKELELEIRYIIDQLNYFEEGFSK